MIDASSKSRPSLPPNDRFGYLFATISALAVGYFYWQEAIFWVVLFGIAATGFLLAARFAPGVLAPLNRLWFQLGLLLGRIVSPVVLGIIFFLMISPVALLTRLFGRDPLLMKRRAAVSYWIERNPPGPKPDSFKNQF